MGDYIHFGITVCGNSREPPSAQQTDDYFYITQILFLNLDLEQYKEELKVQYKNYEQVYLEWMQTEDTQEIKVIIVGVKSSVESADTLFAEIFRQGFQALHHLNYQ